MSHLIERLRTELSLTRTSFVLLGVVVIMLAFVIVREWQLFIDYHSRVGVDWLLVGVFILMLLLLMINASLKKDITLIVVSLLGGFLIEAWGTNTILWAYYTELPPYNDLSRPPWWIIPAWPTSVLAINRLYMIINTFWADKREYFFKYGYWVIGALFIYYLFDFSWPSLGMVFTQGVVALTILIVVWVKNYRRDFMIVVAGTLLGYLLEYWGTSRQCWMYHTLEVPPLFAVIGHGFSSVVFSRVTFRMHALINRVTGSKLPIY